MRRNKRELLLTELKMPLDLFQIGHLKSEGK